MTRRQWILRAAGAGCSRLFPMPGSCAPSAGVERGIVKVSRLPKLGPPNDGPKEQLWHYTLAFPFQIAPRLAAVSCTIEQSFRPGQDFLN
ncbi:MAG TPA: hypothetical protein VG672_13500, partial [Bryobacteraceae bacterium]|nr:hypothetical protein [Bryobacteraceae bacterium]